jgi:hypothetical protein
MYELHRHAATESRCDNRLLFYFDRHTSNEPPVFAATEYDHNPHAMHLEPLVH